MTHVAATKAAALPASINGSSNRTSNDRPMLNLFHVGKGGHRCAVRSADSHLACRRLDPSAWPPVASAFLNQAQPNSPGADGAFPPITRSQSLGLPTYSPAKPKRLPKIHFFPND